VISVYEYQKGENTMRNFFRITVLFVSLLAVSGCNDSAYLQKIKVSEVDLSNVTNGVYRGTYRLNLPFGYIVGQTYAVVDVAVSNKRFESFHLINIPDWISTNTNAGISHMLYLILREQKMNMDSSSGASYTKKAVQKAIENAFSNSLVK
jgi:uncharacterized protein with FMN-binding domain